MARKRITRRNMSAAERVTLYVYPAHCLLVGANLLTIRRELVVLNPALNAADTSTIPIQLWGAAFFAVGLLLASALVTGYRYWVYLAGACGLYVLWTITQIGAALFGHASPSGWTWAAAMAMFCWASIRGLTSQPHPPVTDADSHTSGGPQ